MQRIWRDQRVERARRKDITSFGHPEEASPSQRRPLHRAFREMSDKVRCAYASGRASQEHCKGSNGRLIGERLRDDKHANAADTIATSTDDKAREASVGLDRYDLI